MTYHMVSISPRDPIPLAVWCGWKKSGLQTTCDWYNQGLSQRAKDLGYRYEVVKHEDCHHAGHPSRYVKVETC